MGISQNPSGEEKAGLTDPAPETLGQVEASQSAQVVSTSVLSHLSKPWVACLASGFAVTIVMAILSLGLPSRPVELPVYGPFLIGSLYLAAAIPILCVGVTLFSARFAPDRSFWMIVGSVVLTFTILCAVVSLFGKLGSSNLVGVIVLNALVSIVPAIVFVVLVMRRRWPLFSILAVVTALYIYIPLMFLALMVWVIGSMVWGWRRPSLGFSADDMDIIRQRTMDYNRNKFGQP